MKDRQAEIFCHIGRVLTSSLNPKDVFCRVMTIIGEYFSPRNWSLLLVEENKKQLKFEIVMGADADKLKKSHLEKEEGIVGWVCQTGNPVIVEDAQQDSRFSPRMDSLLGFKTETVVCVPLLNGSNKVIGAIELINKLVPPSAKIANGDDAEAVSPSKQTFTKNDMQILASIGAFTGIAAENAFLYQKVKELAMVDPLTGVNNRHYFNEILRNETERVKRYKNSICLLMIDVDAFKEINDTYGHIKGDEVLQKIASIIEEEKRESDVLARFGGDEFIVLLPQAGENEGIILATRIQQALKEWNMQRPLNGMNIGISIGIEAAGANDIDQVVQKADDALYRCKNFRKSPQELVSEEQMRYYLWHDLINEKPKGSAS